MRRYLRFPILIIALLAMLISGAFAQGTGLGWTPSATCPTRPGTIEHAKAQADDTDVLLDVVRVTKVRAEQTPAYIVVSEYGACDNNKIIVECCPSTALRVNQQVEVSGKTATVAGQQRIVNATVKGYLNDGNIIYGNISKPIETRYTGTTSDDLAGTGCSGPNVTPVESDENTAEFVETIADAKLKPDYSRIWLYNKAIMGLGDDEYGHYVVIAADGSNDTLRVYTTNQATMLDRAWLVEGLMGTTNGTRCISTDIGPSASYWLCTPRFLTFDAGALAWAKAQPDGAIVTLPKKIVSARLPDCFYVAEPGGHAGLRVQSTRDVTIGRAVNITATMATVGTERTLINATVNTLATGSTQPMPLGMTGRSLGGGHIAATNHGSSTGQVGVEGGYGLNNIGALVRVWGTVTEIADDEHSYWIDDGSRITYTDGGDTHTGVLVSLGATGHWLPIGDLEVGDHIAINGISTCFAASGGDIQRSVRQIGEFGLKAVPWWQRNEINPINGLNNGE